ncbi:unnamed protein product [Dovyalis caffra]|uniref:RING-type domain-containing protein n=1 Tax=Dovyalis caffra TaxID=77055 RepID=A0AAV1R6S3_9ROSI|nr:unnamed protein product [Dovyalis caffra]
MISVLMNSPQSSGICMATLIFYTCFLIPLRQIKQTLFSIIVLLMSSSGSRLEAAEIEYCWDCSRPQRQLLPVPCRFEELQEEGVCCSICLMELEKEDEVSQLSRCMHIFHMDCIEKWIERDHFTCPLCRNSIDHY